MNWLIAICIGLLAAGCSAVLYAFTWAFVWLCEHLRVWLVDVPQYLERIALAAERLDYPQGGSHARLSESHLKQILAAGRNYMRDGFGNLHNVKDLIQAAAQTPLRMVEIKPPLEMMRDSPKPEAQQEKQP